MTWRGGLLGLLAVAACQLGRPCVAQSYKGVNPPSIALTQPMIDCVTQNSLFATPMIVGPPFPNNEPQCHADGVTNIKNMAPLGVRLVPCESCLWGVRAPTPCAFRLGFLGGRGGPGACPATPQLCDAVVSVLNALWYPALGWADIFPNVAALVSGEFNATQHVQYGVYCGTASGIPVGHTYMLDIETSANWPSDCNQNGDFFVEMLAALWQYTDVASVYTNEGWWKTIMCDSEDLNRRIEALAVGCSFCGRCSDGGAVCPAACVWVAFACGARACGCVCACVPVCLCAVVRVAFAVCPGLGVPLCELASCAFTPASRQKPVLLIAGINVGPAALSAISSHRCAAQGGRNPAWNQIHAAVVDAMGYD
jgi:hypothetical protein